MGNELNENKDVETDENIENLCNIEEEHSLGKVQIADDVIAIIAGLAAGEVEGVYRLTGNITGELASKFGKKNPGKGVKVELSPDTNTVKVYIAIEVLYDYSIPTVSAQLQEKVKQTIETMIGLQVEEVNIRIAGVRVGDGK